ncbi:hypothetical protein E5K02_24805 [Hymenobacter metallicola]|uniref:Toxin-antitoxin system YwqK family antitoxin n=1 Tax=Hymenobacter metallicola TaxID=2563114 RepID=A0A4Z0PTH0_9BACT|nr:hypothetical protein E5K02_24805 [Hymenobacter metallicola]
MRIGRGCIASVFLLSLGVGSISCRDKQQERRVQVTYPDGRLHVLATLRGKRLHGRAIEYSPTGTIDNTSHWVEGKRTGVTSYYYPSGALKDSLAFLNDTLHGLSLSYYRNGVLQQVERYTHGVRTGTAVTFDSLGKRKQQSTYDRDGNGIYDIFYSPPGESPLGSPVPITEAKDTIWWGEKYAGSVRFGYPLKGNVTMIVGVLREDRKAVDRWSVVDTFQVVAQSQDGRFYFSYYPKQPGPNSFQYKFIQPQSPWNATIRDSLTVDQQTVTHSFLVKKPRN